MALPDSSVVLRLAAVNAEPSPPLTDASELDEDRTLNEPQPSSQTNLPTKSQPRYVPLLPKPLPPNPPIKRSSILSKTRTSSRSHRLCRVKLCPYEPCNLRSHREYVVVKTAKQLPTGRQQNPTGATAESTKGNGLTQIPRLSLLRGGVDGSPTLPLDGLEEPMFQELFHTFFDFQWEKIARLLFPPPVTRAEQRDAQDAKHNALEVALSAPVFCLHFIAAAHYQINSGTLCRYQDQNTSLLYGKIVKLLRAKLNDFDRTEISDLILVILTLVIFEITTGRTKSLDLHRNAVHYLVKSHGGVHNMKRAIPIILTLDRIISVFTCLPPLYAPPANHFIRKHNPVPPFYGSYFDNPSSLVVTGQQVHQYCVDSCRAIEILEYEGWTFDPRGPPILASPNVYYFFFLRDCLLNDFVRLNVSLAEDRTISRCMLLASKIVDYTVTMDNYMAVLSLELANKVRRVFIDPANDFDQDTHSDILLWILFVLASLAEIWDHHSWALECLKQQLDRKYAGKDWPTDWQTKELDNIHRFVWSDTRFCGPFARACKELQHMLCGPSSRLSIQMLTEDDSEVGAGETAMVCHTESVHQNP